MLPTRTMTVCLNLLLLANGPLCVRTNLRARSWSGWGGQPIQLKPGQTFLTETGKPPYLVEGLVPHLTGGWYDTPSYCV